MRQIFPILLVTCFFALLFSSAGAYYIDRHLVQINVLSDGTAKVDEMFFLVFRNASDLAVFRQKALENGPSIEAWEAFDNNFSTHIDSIKGGTGRIIFEEKQSGERFVSIEYQTGTQVMVKKPKSETSREIIWQINQAVFQSFEAGSVYAIPGNTDISVVLPKNAQIIGDTVPTGVVSGNIVSWSGPINVSGNLVLEYSTEKQIATGVGISKSLQEMVSQGGMPVFFSGIAAAIIIVYHQRKRISGKIESYIIEHSEIESKPAMEEDEID